MRPRKFSLLLIALLLGAATLPALEPASTVLDATLGDLTTYRGGDLPLSIRRNAPRRVWATSSAPPMAEPPDVDHLLHAAVNGVPSAIKNKVAEAQSDAKLKRATRQEVEKYRPKSEAVFFNSHAIVDDYQASYPVALWTPGYSRDGSVAVVALYFPEILHPSVGLYVLESTPGGWVVRARSFLTYL